MIARLLIIVGLFILVADCFDLTITGVALLGALLIGAGVWLSHVFGHDRLMADDETSARLSAVDVELTAAEKGR